MFNNTSKPSQSTSMATTFNERLNEQLINCLNVQTNVIQNLAQYSQHISLQLFEIKNVVEMLSNRVLALQQQQQQPHFAPNHYPAHYYQNPMSHPSIPVSHPPPPTFHHQHPPQMPATVPPQQSMPIRMPNMSTTIASSQSPFFTPTTTIASQPSTASSFSFGTTGTVPASSTQTKTTTPIKSILSIPQQVSMPDFSTKTLSAFPIATTANSTVTNVKPTTTTPFTFGTTSNLASIFGIGNLPTNASVNSAAKPETNADDDGEGGDEDESYEPNVSFQPIVTLSAVEVKTGEEDENVLFCERAKLYRFDTGSNQMKERGVGDMKILQHKTSKTCRILMRREQVLKLCANHQITSQMELKPHQGSANAFLWSATDFADGEAKHETLCIRFKTDEQAKKFAKVFNEVKEMNSKKTGDLPSVGKISLNDDDVIPIDEVKPSAEQIDRAKKLQLPSTFFLYENKEPCKGCPGCEKDTPAATSNGNKATTNAAKNETKSSAPQTPSTAPVSKTPLSSSENIKSPFANADKSQPQIQKQTSTTKDDKPSAETSNATSQYDNKPSIFGNFNGTANSSVFGSSTPTNNTNGSVFGASASIKPSNNATGGFSFPGFGGASSGTPSAGFQFSTPSATTTTTSETKPTFSFGSAAAVTTTPSTNTNSSFSFGATDNKPVFGNAPKTSFADLIKQSTTNDDKSTSNGSEQRVFAGQGSLIFGTSSVNTTKTTTTTTGNNHEDEDGDGGGEDESYEPNVSFKPIVTLAAVEVKTGEEEENVLFCERGKLYRFDAEANQMKERGIGEIKILQQKTTKVCRILMRREQVLKLCANHQITSQMELKPHQGSENAYVWSCMDFADGEAKHETLCIRFKSSDVAKRFVKQFNDAKDGNANAQQ